MTTETLHLAFISRDAAKNACEKWHYSKAVPAGKKAKRTPAPKAKR